MERGARWRAALLASRPRKNEAISRPTVLMCRALNDLRRRLRESFLRIFFQSPFSEAPRNCLVSWYWFGVEIFSNRRCRSWGEDSSRERESIVLSLESGSWGLEDYSHPTLDQFYSSVTLP